MTSVEVASRQEWVTLTHELVTLTHKLVTLTHELVMWMHKLVTLTLELVTLTHELAKLKAYGSVRVFPVMVEDKSIVVSVFLQNLSNTCVIPQVHPPLTLIQHDCRGIIKLGMSKIVAI